RPLRRWRERDGNGSEQLVRTMIVEGELAVPPGRRLGPAEPLRQQSAHREHICEISVKAQRQRNCMRMLAKASEAYGLVQRQSFAIEPALPANAELLLGHQLPVAEVKVWIGELEERRVAFLGGRCEDDRREPGEQHLVAAQKSAIVKIETE